ncbi:hypothetical protein [Undibacterium sp. Ji49W]|uniref:hypothetical protein n=1 Tax=Undibacterium sp. Ji49W TaxID=3413040 RepID=UPI003BF1BE42
MLINCVKNLFVSRKKNGQFTVIKKSLIFLALAVSAQNCLAVTCMEKWLPMFLKEKYSPEDIDKLLAVACKTPVTLVAKSNVATAPDKTVAESQAATETQSKTPAALAKKTPAAETKTPETPETPADAPTPNKDKEPKGDSSKVVFVVADNDASNYMGDRIKSGYTRSAYKVDMTSNSKDAALACVPQFFTLRGIGKINVKLNQAKDSQLESAFVVTNDTPTDNDTSLCKDKSKIVKLGEVVVFPSPDLVTLPPDRYGLTYGTLMVPYKYHVGSKNFSGGTSVGGYMGYRQEKSGLGLGLQFVGFVGAGQIPVTQSVNGQDKTQNLTGLSYGLGIIGTVKDKFHMGFILGADRVNTDAGYKDNGKPWIAIELGYAFF